MKGGVYRMLTHQFCQADYTDFDDCQQYAERFQGNGKGV